MPDSKRMPCLDCKFADWDRTKSGRLHPSGRGECTWKFQPPAIAAAFRWPGSYERGYIPKLISTPLWRKEGLPGDGNCPQFQRGGSDAG